MRNEDLAFWLFIGICLVFLVFISLWLVFQVMQPEELTYTADFPYIPKGKH